MPKRRLRYLPLALLLALAIAAAPAAAKRLDGVFTEVRDANVVVLDYGEGTYVVRLYGTEAPADMNMLYPGLGVLNLAENACRTMHNLCPLRGAKTRDALAWAKYLDQALEAFVPQADALVLQHHWPVWGKARIGEYVAGQRDMYRYLHDQTLRLMSHGLTPNEIAEGFTMPAFSSAMAARQAPWPSVWSWPTLVSTATIPSATLVAS